VKNLLKKISVATCSLVLVLGLLPSVAKADTQSEPFQTKLAESISNLNDSEFDAFLMDYINTNKNKGTTFSQTQKELSLAGVEITEISSVSNSDSNGTVSPLAFLDPTDITLSSYSAKRAGDSFYRVYGEATFSKPETYPASLDLMSIEWDPNKATYYQTSPGPYTTYMDGTQRLNGICLFNVQDSSILTGNYAYAAVYITPKVSNTNIPIASKYVHTFDKATYSWQIGSNVGYASGGFTGGFTFNISGGNLPYSWQIFADNDIYL
jgi:hypothetical protein